MFTFWHMFIVWALGVGLSLGAGSYWIGRYATNPRELERDPGAFLFVCLFWPVILVVGVAAVIPVWGLVVAFAWLYEAGLKQRKRAQTVKKP